jgi:hypothetical protein
MGSNTQVESMIGSLPLPVLTQRYREIRPARFQTRRRITIQKPLTFMLSWRISFPLLQDLLH